MSSTFWENLEQATGDYGRLTIDNGRGKVKRQSVQLWIAVLLTVAGILLLFFGFLTAPLGEIHNSVLVAFGETCTFAGALFGVDYKYKSNK